MKVRHSDIRDEFFGLFETNRNQLGAAVAFHGYTVEGVGYLHRFLIVCNKNKLREFSKLTNNFVVSTGIDVIQGSIHLIEDTKRAWAIGKQGKNQTD